MLNKLNWYLFDIAGQLCRGDRRSPSPHLRFRKGDRRSPLHNPAISKGYLNWGFILAILLVYQIPVIAAVRDPTAPPSDYGEVLKDASDFILNSILISPNRNIAIINGEIVSQGDQIRGAKVTQVLENKVILSKDNKVITLYLIKEKIRMD